jgi:hypothetical protein
MAKPGAFIRHRIGDFTLSSYSLLNIKIMTSVIRVVNKKSTASRYININRVFKPFFTISLPAPD